MLWKNLEGHVGGTACIVTEVQELIEETEISILFFS